LLTLANRARIVSVAQTPLPYPVYVVLGMTLWQTFLDALNGPVAALAAEKNLVTKFNVAPEAIILSKLGEALFNCTVRSLLTAVLFAWYGVGVGPTLLLAPAGVASLVVLGASMGLLLAPMSALYQDVAKSLPIISSFWFFLTPIIYPVPTHGAFARIVRLNPVTPLLAATRELVTGEPLSAPAAAVATAGLALATLGAGWLVYRVSMPIVLERSRG
jgi:lipopolysaccharide transport system permease protein